MIKFFIKIRKKLLTQNKLVQYILYAIGEIVLVVIGILIALNINNHNQFSKNELTIKSALTEIQNNLLEDIESSQSNVIDYLKKDSIYDKIIGDEWTYDDWEQGKVVIIGNNYVDYVINKNGYENLTRNIDKLPAKYELILEDLRFLYGSLSQDIRVHNERIRNTVYTHLDDLFNKDWKLPSSDIKEQMDYYLDSNEYNKHTLKYMNDRIVVFRSSQRYRIKAIETYIKLTLYSV